MAGTLDDSQPLYPQIEPFTQYLLLWGELSELLCLIKSQYHFKCHVKLQFGVRYELLAPLTKCCGRDLELVIKFMERLVVQAIGVPGRSNYLAKTRQFGPEVFKFEGVWPSGSSLV